MSHATMYPIKTDGTVDQANGIDYKNSWLGAMMIWTDLGKKHGLEVGFRPGMMEAVWALHKDPKVPEHERIVMAMTFDKVYVASKNFQRLIEAIEKCRGVLPENCHVFAWSKKLGEWKEDAEIRGACWQGMSVAEDQWRVQNPDKEDDSRPVNIDADEVAELFEDVLADQ